MDSSTANIELLARFYDKYPEYANKTFLSVKVCRVKITRHLVNPKDILRDALDRRMSSDRNPKSTR